MPATPIPTEKLVDAYGHHYVVYDVHWDRNSPNADGEPVGGIYTSRIGARPYIHERQGKRVDNGQKLPARKVVILEVLGQPMMMTSSGYSDKVVGYYATQDRDLNVFKTLKAAEEGAAAYQELYAQQFAAITERPGVIIDDETPTIGVEKHLLPETMVFADPAHFSVDGTLFGLNHATPLKAPEVVQLLIHDAQISQHQTSGAYDSLAYHYSLSLRMTVPESKDNGGGFDQTISIELPNPLPQQSWLFGDECSEPVDGLTLSTDRNLLDEIVPVLAAKNVEKVIAANRPVLPAGVLANLVAGS